MIPRQEWCSPSNPQRNCRPESQDGAEVCKPMSVSSAIAFKRVQSAVGQLLARDQEPMVQVDGRLGGRTLSAVNLYISPGFADCNALAARADEVADRLVSMLSKPAVARVTAKKSGFPAWFAVLALAAGALLWVNRKPKRRAS